MSSGGIYTGYVIDANASNGYNPVQVWVPALHGNYVTGEWKAFGANTGSALTAEKINELKITCGQKGMFYRTMPVGSGSDSFYLEGQGASTADAGTWQYDSDSGIEDLRLSSSTSYHGTVTGRGEGKSFIPAWSETGLTSHYTLSDTHGIRVNSYAGQPQGTYTSIAVGSRVLICMADSGSTGFIIAQIPTPSNYNSGLMVDAAALPTN